MDMLSALPKRTKLTRRQRRMMRKRVEDRDEVDEAMNEENAEKVKRIDCDDVKDVEEKKRPVGETDTSEKNFEYLPHPADVQLHAWGKSIEESFCNAVLSMNGYLTDLDSVEIDERCEFKIEAKGHDMISLLYKFMDEFLYIFNTEDIIAREVCITLFDKNAFRICAIGRGERFDLRKHPQGTEVKAITYSAMQIHEKDDGVHVFVVVDI